MAAKQQDSMGSSWANRLQWPALKNHFLALIWICFGLTLLPSLVSDVEAATDILFGPETFLRGDGGPQTEIRTFAGPGVDCRLLVQNGDSKATRVSSATIDLNGVSIVQPSDLNKQVLSLEKPILVLDGSNTLDITLNSTPGSFLVVSVTCVLQNAIPVADAGPDQTAFVTETITLDASASSDGDGDTLAYVWSLLSTPAGSTASVSDLGAIGPTFAIDLPGSYVAELIVNDGSVDGRDPDFRVIGSNLLTLRPILSRDYCNLVVLNLSAKDRGGPVADNQLLQDLPAGDLAMIVGGYRYTQRATK